MIHEEHWARIIVDATSSLRRSSWIGYYDDGKY